MIPVKTPPSGDTTIRRPTVLNNHRSDVVSPRSILPREEEKYFMHALHEIMVLEKELEIHKINLS